MERDPLGVLPGIDPSPTPITNSVAITITSLGVPDRHLPLALLVTESELFDSVLVDGVDEGSGFVAGCGDSCEVIEESGGHGVAGEALA